MAQDVARCQECTGTAKSAVDAHCTSCEVSLCNECVGKHISSKPKESNSHNFVKFQDLISKKNEIREDAERLEKTISFRHRETVDQTKAQIARVSDEYNKIDGYITDLGKEWHNAVDAAVTMLRSNNDKLRGEDINVLQKYLDEEDGALKQVLQTVEENRMLLKTKKSKEIIAYKSIIDKWDSLISQPEVKLPNFKPFHVDVDKLHKQMGIFRFPIVFTSARKYILSVVWKNDKEIWTAGGDNEMQCMNMEGNILQTVKTQSGGLPTDLAINKDGALFYSDMENKTVHCIQEQNIITLQNFRNWKPQGIYVNFLNDLLVCMRSDDSKQSKVVCYSKSSIKQEYQFDKERKALFSTDGSYLFFVAQSKDMDICVSDGGVDAVVVLKDSGELKFRYTSSHVSLKNKFSPVCIDTDDKCQILIADRNNNTVHLINKEGQLMSFIDIFGITCPFGLSISFDGKLIISQNTTEQGKFKVVEYI